MSILIVDCTELYLNPIRTGIQRVVRELLRHWPHSGPQLHPARFEPGRGLVRLSLASVALLAENEPGTSALPVKELRSRLAVLAGSTDEPDLPQVARVLIPEIFYDPLRSRFHEERLVTQPGSLAMLSFDFLTFLQPELFRVESALPFMSYFRLISMAPSVAFISDLTRKTFADRIIRAPSDDPRIGPVLPLGADGLPAKRQVWRSNRRDFVCLGSLDGRKNQHVVTAAFMQLWEAGYDFRLVLIGRAFDGLQLDWLGRARAFPHFCWLDEASDEDIAAAMYGARATIYLPMAEGFGLPPIESLHVGVPVITMPDVPSVAMLPLLGQIRLSYPTVEAVTGAVLSMTDDATAERLWAEAASLKLGTWRTFGARAAEWCAGLAAPGSTPTKSTSNHRNRNRIEPFQAVMRKDCDASRRNPKSKPR